MDRRTVGQGTHWINLAAGPRGVRRRPGLERFGPEAARNVLSVLASGKLGSVKADGVFNRALEDGFGRLLGVPFALTFSSATAGMIAALQAVGVGPEDEVIVDPLVKFGAVAALHCGAVPVFADVDPCTFLLDPSSLSARVTDRTRAIVCTALYGLVPAMEAIVELAAARRIAVVEDCAQAMLAERAGRPAGTWGDVGVFSFQSTKHLCTGEGGLVVTRSAETHGACQAIRDHGWRADGGECGRGLPHNYRMTELAAAVGVAQLPVIGRVVDHHGQLAKLFDTAVAGTEWLIPQRVDAATTRHAYWLWSARWVDGRRGAQLVSALAAESPDFRLGCYPGGPAYLRPLFQRDAAGAGPDARSGPHPAPAYRRGLCPNAESVAESVLTIRLDCERSWDMFEANAKRLARLASLL